MDNGQALPSLSRSSRSHPPPGRGGSRTARTAPFPPGETHSRPRHRQRKAARPPAASDSESRGSWLGHLSHALAGCTGALRGRQPSAPGVARPQLELPELGRFDVVVSSLAIHHVPDRRKRSLYREIFECVEPGGVFFNLEHVTPGSPALHSQYLSAIGLSPGDEDASNQLAPVETQLRWLREIGFVNVDCYWKRLELALLGGAKDRS
jgi:SAM-dependent methyltransferase